MKSAELVVGVALSIALSLLALTCTAKSPPLADHLQIFLSGLYATFH
jgi:hypothetical protein